MFRYERFGETSCLNLQVAQKLHGTILDTHLTWRQLFFYVKKICADLPISEHLLQILYEFVNQQENVNYSVIIMARDDVCLKRAVSGRMDAFLSRMQTSVNLIGNGVKLATIHTLASAIKLTLKTLLHVITHGHKKSF